MVFRSRIFLPRSLTRYCLVVTAALFSAVILLTFSGQLSSEAAAFVWHDWAGSNAKITCESLSTLVDPHPIDTLIAAACRAQQQALERQSTDVASAARRYREARGRHPPPGFDKWFAHAKKTKAVVVEDFFDRIYHDLRPFWALDARTTALRARSWHHVVRVRNGTATAVGDTTNLVAWLALWTEAVAEAAQWLPDVDMPFNYMDESRLLVKWEDVDKYVSKEEKERKIVPPEKTTTKFTGLGEVDRICEKNTTACDPYDPRWITDKPLQYWDYMRAACPPETPSRNVPAGTNFTAPPDFSEFTLEAGSLGYLRRGFVENATASRDPCLQPHLRYMHGSFIEPLSMSTSQELIPLFGGSKLPGNNDILIPGAMYFTKDPFYSGGESKGPRWEKKTDRIVWRGVASGGRHKKENWKGFQRLRLIEMLNGTTVSSMERSGKRAETFPMPPANTYDFPRRRDGTVGEWLNSTADAGFVERRCFPDKPVEDCSYLDPYFHDVPRMSMADQYAFKYIPDADGNSFSARYRGLLRSTSLPLKATLYAEWHDDRLMPWLHYAPLDNTFQDLHAVLDYFMRDKHGDDAARLLAESGSSWAEKVLRREDMVLYMWRLLLEFARVCDENRDAIGYVDDLTS